VGRGVEPPGPSGTHEIGFDSAADTITIAAYRAEPGGFALEAIKSGPVDCGQAGFFTSFAIFYSSIEEVAHVYGMRYGYGYAVPGKWFARLKRAAELVRRQIEQGIDFLVPCGTDRREPDAHP